MALDISTAFDRVWHAGQIFGLISSFLSNRQLLSGSGWRVFTRISSFKMLGLTFSSKLDWGSYITSIAKTTSKKIEALILSVKFLSPEVTLYL